MKTYNRNHYRQGDVLIESIAEIPTTAEKQAKSARIILADPGKMTIALS